MLETLPALNPKTPFFNLSSRSYNASAMALRLPNGYLGLPVKQPGPLVKFVLALRPGELPEGTNIMVANSNFKLMQPNLNYSYLHRILIKPTGFPSS